ncbi:DUF2637 domain-containing protein [Streptomyces sp. NPDC044948]|uniref:DUF2637 domain-containing protein n=1 Tax=Streptomyces sp. NPDC044948 TaxID=3157092 RepID=UPI00340DCB9C
MKRNPAKALAVAAGLVIIALTAAAFWLSYAHLAEVALAHGMHDKEIRAWAWPATLDLFIVAGELLMLRAALAGRVDWWAIGLTVAGSGSSIALNVAGVGSHAEPLDYVTAAVPPTAALLAFGALMRQIHQALAGQVAGAQDYAPEARPVTEVTTEVTVERVEDDQSTAALEPGPLVIPEPTYAPVWDAYKAVDTAKKVTAAVPAEETREVVTEVIALTPADLRRKARRLNREAVTATRRPVTIKTLQDVLGLSRRDATDLRREVVGSEQA